LNAFAHFSRSFIGKGNGEDFIGSDRSRRQEICDAVGEDSSFARAGAGDDEQR
jgi:hypothetical protein